MSSTLASGGRYAGAQQARQRRAANALGPQASPVCAVPRAPRPTRHRDQEQRRVARLGGARPSLEEAIAALLGDASHECLLCSGSVRQRSRDGALVCCVCESVLGRPDLAGPAVSLEAA